jgi:hypothetical protein
MHQPPKKLSISPQIFTHQLAAKAAGLLTTKITESPLKNILLTYRSLLMDVPRFLPLPPLENSVHISLTSSSNLEKREGDFWDDKRINSIQ